MMTIARTLGLVMLAGMLLAACSVGAPAGVPTVVVPTVNVPAAIQTASNIPAQVGTIAANTVTIQLAAENSSGETGTAVLTEVSGKTTVVIAVAGEPAGASQPMHIHDGNCGANLGGIKYTLTPLANGVSTTTVDVTIAQLKAAKFAINGRSEERRVGKECRSVWYAEL